MIYLKRQATVKGGRDGHITTPNNSLDLKMAKPEEMGGSPNQQTNPEELFLAGYIGCLASSFEFLAGKMDAAYDALEIAGKIDLQDNADKGGFEFGVRLTFKIQGLSDEQKQTLVAQTFGFCPFSRAIKGNVDVSHTIV